MILTQSLHLSCLDCRQKYVHSVSALYPCISIPTNENRLNDAIILARPQLSNLGGTHSHILMRTNIIRDAFGVRLAIPVLTTPTSWAIPSITVHEQHLLSPSSYISSRARFSLLFYRPFSPTSAFSSPLHLIFEVNCLLTIRFSAHRSAKFDVHP